MTLFGDQVEMIPKKWSYDILRSIADSFDGLSALVSFYVRLYLFPLSLRF